MILQSVEEIENMLGSIPLLRGVQGEDVGQWLGTMEASLLKHGVPQRQWPDSVISHISPDSSLKTQMHEQRSSTINSDWTWEHFKSILTEYHHGKHKPCLSTLILC